MISVHSELQLKVLSHPGPDWFYLGYILTACPREKKTQTKKTPLRKVVSEEKKHDGVISHDPTPGNRINTVQGLDP